LSRFGGDSTFESSKTEKTMKNSIEITSLSHQFSKNEPILNNINLSIPEGSIYGFLSPNGAGKTTTLQLALNLLPQQSGEIRIFGKSFDRDRIKIGDQLIPISETYREAFFKLVMP
jgi:ABC-type multidrug transport system ATPase subunit